MVKLVQTVCSDTASDTVADRMHSEQEKKKSFTVMPRQTDTFYKEIKHLNVLYLMLNLQ